MAKSKGKGDKADRSVLEREVLLAMRAEGWLTPETEAEVLEAEKKLAAQQITIPTSFDYPRELLRRAGRVRTIHHPQSKNENSQTTENLARAARRGAQFHPKSRSE